MEGEHVAIIQRLLGFEEGEELRAQWIADLGSSSSYRVELACDPPDTVLPLIRDWLETTHITCIENEEGEKLYRVFKLGFMLGYARSMVEQDKRINQERRN